MAKAVFHKNQRVYVTPVGTWALIEKVVPHWTKGLNEPLRITYDVGLGREFAADELVSEELVEVGLETESENWRIMRARNKWQQDQDCAHHPIPGTYPVIVTNDKNWGGWRVPGAEYDYDPHRIETQARIMANALKMLALLRRLADYAGANAENLPKEVVDIAREGYELRQYIEDTTPEKIARAAE